MMRLILHFAVFLLCLCTTDVFAQRSKSRVNGATTTATNSFISADAYAAPRAASDSADVYIVLKIDRSQLLFSKVSSFNEQRGNYFAIVSLSAEARDHVGVIRQRVRYIDTLFVDSYEAIGQSSRYHLGRMHMELAAGQYTVAIESIGRNTKSVQKIVLPTLVLPRREQGNVKRVSCVFATPVNRDFDTLRPIVFNGNIPFPSSSVVCIATIPQVLHAPFDIWIRQQPYQENDIQWWSDVTLHTSASNAASIAGVTDRSDVVINQTVTSGSNLLIPFDASLLVPGRYELTIAGEGARDTLRYPFTVEWENMPLSLRSISYALDALAYICPEEQLDSLQEGSDTERRIKLMNWWTTFDRSTSTAFNEHMAEYYRRVDHASVAYATLMESDGVFTDRGKIYILFGEPTKIDRKTNKKGEQTESWIYSNAVRQMFVYTIDDNGRYTLTTVQHIKK